MKRNKVIIIGGGASGLMAGGVAAQQGADVLILEKNKKTGRKILITGKGRCNITNYCDNDTFISNVPTNPRFLYSSINAFSTYDAVSFFESLNVKTKVERGNRVFPESDKAMDVADALYHFATSNGCKIRQATVKKLITDGDKVSAVYTDDGREYLADSIVIACGGLSYPQTGSTGDGYTLAKQVGHTVSKTMPSLIPLESDDRFCLKLQGLSLRNISIKVTDNNDKSCVYTDFGEMLFTHFGVSGPVILSASAHMRSMSKNRYTVTIDLKPALDEQTLDKRILRDFSEFCNRDFENSLSKLLPNKIIPVIIDRSGIDPHTKCNSITSQMRHNLVNLIKNFTVNISGFRPISEAVITCGGVNVNEINPKTMESKLIKSLYFAGEVIDVDAYTGGFNLQIAFSTGYLCGINAADNSKE